MTKKYIIQGSSSGFCVVDSESRKKVSKMMPFCDAVEKCKNCNDMHLLIEKECEFMNNSNSLIEVRELAGHWLVLLIGCYLLREFYTYESAIQYAKEVSGAIQHKFRSMGLSKESVLSGKLNELCELKKRI